MRKLFLLLAFLVAGCSRISIDEYAGSSPALDLKEFFDGELRAYGILQDRSGRVTRKFEATITAYWRGEEGTLEEHFVFDDGEQQDRTWTLVHLGDNRYTGQAGDVIGTASGRASIRLHGCRTDARYRESVILTPVLLPAAGDFPAGTRLCVMLPGVCRVRNPA